jgi:hypothetical protein
MAPKMWAFTTAAYLISGYAGGPAAAAAGAQTDKNVITVTGCLEPDTLNTINSQTGLGYKLTVKKSGEAEVYILDGSDSSLKPQVGHQIEVTGVPAVAKDATMAPELKKAAPAVTAGGTRTVDNGMRRLRVTSIRMVASDCSSRP